MLCANGSYTVTHIGRCYIDLYNGGVTSQSVT